VKEYFSHGLWGFTWCSFVDVTNITEECAVFGVMTQCGLLSVAIITEEHAITIFTTGLWFVMKQFIILQC